MLVLSRDDVVELLDLRALVDALGDAMREFSAGDAVVPPRVAARVAQSDAMLAAMPAFLPSARALTAKLVTQFPHNTDRPSHQAVVCCFDPDDGTPLAIMDGEYLTNARTAAGSVLSSRLLAREDARMVAVIGTGALARAHLAAFTRESGVGRILIAGRNPERVAHIAAETGAGAVASIEEAVRAADILCLCTHASEPVIERKWLPRGVHVCSVGYNPAGSGEVDLDTIRDSLVVVESRESALAPPPSGAPELTAAIAAGVLDPADVREIGELGESVGLQSFTLYKSVGVGVQDAAAAALVLRAAASSGIGSTVEL